MTRSILFATTFASAAAVIWLVSPLFSVSSAVALLAPSFLSGGSDTPTYRTVAVERGDIVETIKAAGTLNALGLVEVGSQISGQIKDLSADFNSQVTQGEVIARVEPEIYEAKLAQAQAEVEMAETRVPVQRAQVVRDQAAVENAKAAQQATKAETIRAEVALDNAKRDVERKRPLVQSNVISTRDWEHVQNAYRTAEADVTASRAQELSKAAAVRVTEAALHMSEAELTNTEAEVKQRKAALLQAQINVDRTYIRAPVTGTVIYRAVSGGQTVAASLQTPILFTIAQDLTQMQVEASVVEADVSRFKVGQPVTFIVDAYPDRLFAGTVKQIRKNPKTIQNIVTYIVVISTENPDEVLFPGMTANLQVVVAKRLGALKIPNMALRFRPPGQPDDGRADANAIGAAEPGAGRVFVLDNEGHAKPVTLRLGITDGRATEVMAGELKEGQLVITGTAARQQAPEATSSFLSFRLR